MRVKLPADSASRAVVRPRIGEGTRAEIALETDDLPEFVEETAAALPGGAHRAALPAILNGRILHPPGEADIWQVTAHKGDSYLLDLRAGRLGSLLDSVLTILDSKGKQLATCDDISAGQTDSQLAWKVAADGNYSIRVEDRLLSRGGPRYSYRLKIEPANRAADFQLKLAVNALNIERGAVATLPIAIERRGGFKGPVALEIDGLPAGVTASGLQPVGGGKADTPQGKPPGKSGGRDRRCAGHGGGRRQDRHSEGVVPNGSWRSADRARGRRNRCANTL